MTSADQAPQRRILLRPEPELARRIDVTAALAGRTAPDLILSKLDAELPHYEPLQPSTVEAVNGR